MLYLYINNSEVTEYLEANTLSINSAIQQRADTASFSLLAGVTAPEENQDIRIYKGATIKTVAGGGATLTLDPIYQTGVDYFYKDQKLRIRIGDSDEETVEVQTYTESTNTLILKSAPSGTVSVGDKIGVLMFGGVISRVANRNVQVLQNLEYDIDATDYTKIFNKKLVNETYEDVGALYIINNFVNYTVNFAKIIDSFSYINATAIRAVWTESGDGDNPNINTTDYLEATNSGQFSWTNSGGTATFTGAFTPQDYSEFTGATSGTPSKGSVMIWIKPSDYTDITAITLKVGSDSSNYISLSLDVPVSNEWTYIKADLVNGSVTGTPDWELVDYVEIIITQTGSSNILLNGLRVLAENSFTLYNVEDTPVIDDYRLAFSQPTSVLQTLSKTWSYVWYIDYLRDVHFKDLEAEAAPIEITNTSNNFFNLKMDIDQSNVGNRIVVQGGEQVSTNDTAQVFIGDNTKREWVLADKFANLEITIDNNTSTDTMEAGTTTTTVNATGHGLLAGDHVVMRSRGNVVREVLTVPDPDSFTVQAVTGQTSGDIFSKFDTTKTDGIEGLVDETTVDYVYNSNAQSVKATTSEDTLTETEFIRFQYNPRFKVQYQYTDTASVNALKAAGLGDGIFDLDTYNDSNIDSQALAIQIAQAQVQEFSNPIISGGFKTDKSGLRSGQIININDSNRSSTYSGEFLIQKVTLKQRGGEFFDYFESNVKFGSTLFGVMEFFQKLLAQKNRLEINADIVVSNFVDASEVVECSESNSVSTTGGDERAVQAETVETSESNQVVDFPAGTWRWEPNGVGQPLQTRWNLFDWG